MSAPGITSTFLNAEELFIQVLQGNSGSVSVNGGTSGSAIAYQVLQGTFKLLLVQCNAIRSAVSTNPTITLPVAFTFGYRGFTSGCGPLQMMLSGVAQTVQQLTSFSAGNDNGVTPATTVKQNWLFHSDFGLDTIKFTGDGSAHTGLIILTGI